MEKILEDLKKEVGCETLKCIEVISRYFEEEENKLTAAEAQVRELTNSLNRLKTHTYCVGCGKEFELDVDGKMILGHIRMCHKHPLTATIETQKEQIAELKHELSMALKEGMLFKKQLVAKTAELQRIYDEGKED